MKKDNIKNAKEYYNISERIELGLKYLETTDFSFVENGKHVILGEEIYALVQEYSSKLKSECKFEAHRKYIDIQYVIKGEEQMGVENIGKFNDLTPYDTEKDIVFLTPNDEANPSFVNVKEGEFMIFMPEDAHMPSVAIENPTVVKKVVVKVLY